MQNVVPRNKARKKIHRRNRYRILREGRRLRLVIFRSGKHVYAQVIEDSTGRTLASASSLDREIRDKVKRGNNIPAAKVVGQALAERCLSKGIHQVVFDRGGYAYHGRVKAFAAAAREGGLKF